jgi:cyanophycinase
MIKTNHHSYFKVFIGLSTSILWQFTSTKNERKIIIIGGGHRSDALMTQLVTLADLGKKRLCGCVTSTEEPDSAYIYLKKQFGKTGPQIQLLC